MKKLLLVIDMQEGFCKKENPLYVGDQCNSLIPFITEKIEEYNKNGQWIFFTGDQHELDDNEFKMFPPHCVRGTSEVAILKELWKPAKKKKVFFKTRYSAFYKTNLEQEINELHPEIIEIVGVCTNICVLFTCEELRNRDYQVHVPKDGVTSFDLDAHQYALRQMFSVLGVKID